MIKELETASRLKSGMFGVVRIDVELNITMNPTLMTNLELNIITRRALSLGICK